MENEMDNEIKEQPDHWIDSLGEFEEGPVSTSDSSQIIVYQNEENLEGWFSLSDCKIYRTSEDFKSKDKIIGPFLDISEKTGEKSIYQIPPDIQNDETIDFHPFDDSIYTEPKPDQKKEDDTKEDVKKLVFFKDVSEFQDYGSFKKNLKYIASNYKIDPKKSLDSRIKTVGYFIINCYFEENNSNIKIKTNAEHNNKMNWTAEKIFDVLKLKGKAEKKIFIEQYDLLINLCYKQNPDKIREIVKKNYNNTEFNLIKDILEFMYNNLGYDNIKKTNTEKKEFFRSKKIQVFFDKYKEKKKNWIISKYSLLRNDLDIPFQARNK